VKLYPSCAGTHPSLDAILDLRRREGFNAGDVERIDIDVDSIVPTILIYERPATGLEGKFSLPFCAAAAVVFGRVGIDTFDAASLTNPQVTALMPHVAMRVDPALDRGAPPLTHARVHLTLRDGRVLTQEANGARGYPEQPASDAELDAKFMACAGRALSEPAASRALGLLRGIGDLDDVRLLTAVLGHAPASRS
jgi:2-methylcitrate dehydratase PrpD